MPRINLDDVVPEDIEFDYRGKTYTISGDLDVETTFKLIGLFGDLADAEVAGDRKKQLSVNGKLEQLLLDLFKEHDPSLEKLPFGVVAYRNVVTQLLGSLGLEVIGGDPPADPSKPTAKKRAPRRRSSGSRS